MSFFCLCELRYVNKEKTTTANNHQEAEMTVENAQLETNTAPFRLSFQWYITLDWAKAPGKGTGGKRWAIRDQYMARAQYWRTSSCIVLSYSKNTPMDIKIFWHGAMEIPRGDPELWDGNFNLTYPNFCLSNSWKQPQKETYSEI